MRASRDALVGRDPLGSGSVLRGLPSPKRLTNISKELSPSGRPFSASQRAPSRPSGFRAVFGAESLGIDSARVENIGELFMKARFTLCVSTVRRGSVSHPISCRSDCPSSVRACFEGCHVHGCATLTDSRENMYYGVTKCQCGATARSSLSV